MIEAKGLTRRYGDKLAVDDLTFTAEDGQITGFVGPNGSGKSTTMRMILGLDKPTAGTALVNGKPFAQHPDPMAQAGALLDQVAANPGHTARDHMRGIAASNGISSKRVDEVIEMVGLSSVANKRVRGFSLGMRQRVGIGTALLGRPKNLILDEPLNGLDPQGVRWVNETLVSLRDQGTTVLLSSHLINELATVADHMVVIGKGKLLVQSSVADMIGKLTADRVLVRSPQAQAMTDLLTSIGGTVTSDDSGTLHVTGVPIDQIGAKVAETSLVLHELAPDSATLEQAVFDTTNTSVEYRGEASDAAKPNGSAGSESRGVSK